ncbi:MAG: GDP-mannose 4,6-dehydratase [Candidatus Omnitrophica bacterium]|nr:GDP-mannose 4,6-dehydratase [Candidatus Omnitrophota bacterium]
MKYLVTGISGFVGAYLFDQLSSKGHDVVGVDAYPLSMPLALSRFYQMSLMDQSGIRGVIEQEKPQRIVHLASASSVGSSWQQPTDCFVNNTNIFLNLIEAVRLSGLKCRILSVGSSEEYGPVAASEMPLKEIRPANPMNPYAVARVAQENMSRVFAKGYGMDIVCTRSFNHIGPGQTDRFVVSSFVRQAVEVSRGQRPKIICGDLDVVRDFVDVRDVIAAYDCILDKGISGEIYNVCSGQGVTLRSILERICSKVGIPADFQVDPALIRPIDNPVIIGDNTKLCSLGFALAYEGLDAAIDGMVVWWQKKLDEGGKG